MKARSISAGSQPLEANCSLTTSAALGCKRALAFFCFLDFAKDVLAGASGSSSGSRSTFPVSPVASGATARFSFCTSWVTSVMIAATVSYARNSSGDLRALIASLINPSCTLP